MVCQSICNNVLLSYQFRVTLTRQLIEAAIRSKVVICYISYLLFIHHRVSDGDVAIVMYVSTLP